MKKSVTRIMAALLVALAATVVVSLATKRPSAEMIAEFESVDRE